MCGTHLSVRGKSHAPDAYEIFPYPCNHFSDQIQQTKLDLYSRGWHPFPSFLGEKYKFLKYSSKKKEKEKKDRQPIVRLGLLVASIIMNLP